LLELIHRFTIQMLNAEHTYQRQIEFTWIVTNCLLLLQ